MPSSPPALTARFGVDTRFGLFLGDTRIRLLEMIDVHGSISQAAKAVPLSYKAAWDAVDAMNNLAPEPLVLRATGGRHGGGTALTDYGRRLVAFYRALEAEYQAALERLAGPLQTAEAADVEGFRQLLRKLSMKSSARNQFAGPVIGLKEGVVDCEVTLQIDEALALTALVTRESAENLGLRQGREVQAFVKSSSILLVDDPTVRISARNRFSGVVARIHEGPVNAEVTISLPNRRHVLTAVITHESLRSMRLGEGSPVTAVFKASSVFLVAAA